MFVRSSVYKRTIKLKDGQIARLKKLKDMRIKKLKLTIKDLKIQLRSVELKMNEYKRQCK